ncbi:restriction endonuclease [Pseudomonas aeruginosa]|nr:restriction endonuclease [Pseudomonas aeruginosa]MCT5541732.1 restriction endonuclease [Pseudomonas aeruginosa]
MNSIRLIAAFCIAMGVVFGIEFYKQNFNIVNVIVFFFLIAAGVAAGWYRLVKIPSWRRARAISLRKELEKHGASVVDEFGLLILKADYMEITTRLECKLLNTVAEKFSEKHLRTLARKKSQSIFANDYGRVIEAGWQKELTGFVRNELFFEFEIQFMEVNFEAPAATHLLDPTQVHVIEYWASFVDSIISDYDSCAISNKKFEEVSSGHEYESFVAALIVDLGWSAKVTPGSGDHGADIIAENEGERVAIQCKLYTGPVGNKSVQEAFSAKSYYDFNLACVVSNSSFTHSAKQAASKLGVALLHHDDLEDYLGS